MTRSNIQIIIVLLVALQTPVLAQLGPMPAWYATLAATPLDQLDQYRSLAFDYCHTDVVGPGRYLTSVEVERYTLRAQTDQGVLAVTSFDLTTGAAVEHGGLDTGLWNVLSLDGPFQLPGAQPNEHYIVIAGIRADLISTVQVLFVYDGVVPDPSNLITLPITGTANEAFITASAVDGMIYIVDGVTPKIIRYIDTNSDLVPDTRDTTFLVDLNTGVNYLAPNPPPLYPFPISGFRSHSDPNLTRVHYSGASLFGHRFDAIVYHPLYGGYTLEGRWEQIHNDLISSLPIFGLGTQAFHLQSGQDRVGILGADATSVVVEAGPSETGPWTSIAGPVTVAGTLDLNVISLTGSVTSGQFVRVREAAATTGTTVRVGSMSLPVVFSPRGPTSVSPGDLRFSGDNLNGTLTAHFYRFDTQVETALTIPSQTKHELTVTIPSSLSTVVGRVRFKDAGGTVVFEKLTRVQ